MKTLFTLVTLFLGLIGPQANFTALSKNDATPRAEFRSMSVDYDVYEATEKGMRIHVNFTTYDMKEIEGYLAIYFGDDNGPLQDRNQAYYTTTGTVAVFRLIKPQYDIADYNDLTVFMPYTELDLDDGDYNLEMDVKVIYKEGGVISSLTTRSFEYKQSGSDVYNSVNVSYKNMRVDFDVYENEVKGSRIHVDFTVGNMKGIDCYLVASVYTTRDEPVPGKNPSFATDNGQAATFRMLTPGYVETVYNDLQLFLPYSALSVGAGRQYLKLDVDLVDLNEELIRHLTYYEFWYEE